MCFIAVSREVAVAAALIQYQLCLIPGNCVMEAWMLAHLFYGGSGNGLGVIFYLIRTAV